MIFEEFTERKMRFWGRIFMNFDIWKKKIYIYIWRFWINQIVLWFFFGMMFLDVFNMLPELTYNLPMAYHWILSIWTEEKNVQPYFWEMVFFWEIPNYIDQISVSNDVFWQELRFFKMMFRKQRKLFQHQYPRRIRNKSLKGFIGWQHSKPLDEGDHGGS